MVSSALVLRMLPGSVYSTWHAAGAQFVSESVVFVVDISIS